MIPELREQYNRDFSEEKFARFLERLDYRTRLHIEFRVCETPLFVPKEIQRLCEDAAVQLALDAHDPEYLKRSDATLYPEIAVPGQSDRATFLAVDFAMTAGPDGNIVPKLIELQGFPSLMGYQLFLSELMQEHFSLPSNLTGINGGHSRAEFLDLLHRTIVAGHDPEHVILMELDPWKQKTCPDFSAIHELLGIAVVDVRDVKKQGNRLFYTNGKGQDVRVERIFNRTIVDEIERRNVALPFRWNDDLHVEWAGHPNWFFRISKYTLPFLKHPLVPPASFLSDLDVWPENLANYVLKPLFSFAGAGVIVGPSREDLDAIPKEDRSGYLLQERIEFCDAVSTPYGGTKAEMRVMLVWPDDEERPLPVMGLVRMGRGEKMGVDQNRDMKWIGAGCNFFEV